MSTISNDFADKNVCILGLGYVGFTLAIVMAETGFRINGVEIREDVLDLMAEGKSHFYEPGINKRLSKVLKNDSLVCSNAIQEDFGARVYIVTVGTPLGADGKVKIDGIVKVCESIAAHLKDGDLVIMRSTVRLGTVREVVKPILDGSGVDYDLAFCPERTIEGKALTELRHLPQIVGGLTPRASERAAHLFQFITPTVVRVSDVETAEMVKMIDNGFRDVLFAYANEVARICDAIGVSAVEVIEAGKSGYARTNLPLPGPVGGPCLEKDPYIFAEGLLPYKLKPELTLAARQINERQPAEVVSQLKKITDGLVGWPEKPVITLMGLAFKGQPPTDDLRGTMARPVFEALRLHFPSATFRGFDAMVSANHISEFGLDPFLTLEEAMAGAHLTLILNNHPVFEQMSIEDLAEGLARPGLIYDFWNLHTTYNLDMPKGTGYIALGSCGKAILPGESAS